MPEDAMGRAEPRRRRAAGVPQEVDHWAGPTTRAERARHRRVPARIRRRRTLVAAVLLILGATTAVIASPRSPEPADVGAPDPVVRTSVSAAAPAPTTTLRPITRPEGTAFAEALPGAVGEWVLAEQGRYDSWIASGAVESYRLAYTNGTDEIDLLAGQWPAAKEAATMAATLPGLRLDAEDPGDKTVDAQAPDPGSDLVVAFVAAAASADPGIVWCNRTAVFQVTGVDADAARRFWAAFPM